MTPEEVLQRALAQLLAQTLALNSKKICSGEIIRMTDEMVVTMKMEQAEEGADGSL